MIEFKKFSIKGMNLSTFVYDAVDEVSKIEKNQNDLISEQVRATYLTVHKLEELNTTLQIQNEKFKLYEKELRTESEKMANELDALKEKTEVLKAKCKDQTKIIAEIKDYDKKIHHGQKERIHTIDEQVEKAFAEIQKLIDFDPQEVDKVKGENLAMKEEMQKAMDLFKENELNYRKKIEDLKGEFQEMQNAMSKEIEEFQRKMIELQILKSEREISKSKLTTIRQKINLYYEKIPKFYQMIKYKENQYEKYSSEIKEILIKFRNAITEKDISEETIKLSNQIFFELHQEVV